MSHKIAFIGAGNMGSSIIMGLLAHHFQPSDLIATGRDELRLAKLAKQGVETSINIVDVASRADILLLCVKPQGISDVMATLKPALTDRNPLILSIVTGTTLQALSEGLGSHLSIVRSMPNLAATVSESMTALVANDNLAEDDKTLATDIFTAVGKTLWVDDENTLDAITGVSGSGPAYFLYLMENMMLAAKTLGLSAEQAKALTLQTAMGAAKLVAETQEEPATLRGRITSPNGTTAAGIAVFDEHHSNQHMQDVVLAAAARAKALREAS